VRLFVALEIPPEVRERLTSLVQDLRAAAPQLKWVRVENLHLTLKFMGEADIAKLATIRSALSGVRSREAIEFRVGRLDFFPDKKRPRVFWVGVEAEPELARLASDIDTALVTLGFPREERAFTPHLTLARLEGTRLSEKFREAIAKRATQEFGSVQAEFHLIGSKLRPMGAEYTTVQSFPFVVER